MTEVQTRIRRGSGGAAVGRCRAAPTMIADRTKIRPGAASGAGSDATSFVDRSAPKPLFPSCFPFGRDFLRLSFNHRAWCVRCPIAGISLGLDARRELVMRREFLLALAVAAPLALGASDASAQVKIGVAGPITGGSAAFGAQLKNGVEQAVADINAAGGILGQKIVLSVGDDRADPKEGVSVANKFIGDGVKFVVGHFNSGVTIPSSDVYNEHGMLVITPSATK